MTGRLLLVLARTETKTVVVTFAKADLLEFHRNRRMYE
jgi:hypothetical protein